MFHSLRKKINNYDPYGVMQVNALQSLTLVLGLLFIDKFYNLPGFREVIILPLLGIIIIGTLFGYYPRIKALSVFCLVTILYSLIFCSVKNYLTFTVLITGLGIAIFFILSRRVYPPLLNMIALIQVVASVLSLTPNGGDLYQLIRLAINLSIVSLLSISLMALFPKIYFFRVWERAFYLTIEEMSNIMYQMEIKKLNFQQLLFTHLVAMNKLTQGLSYYPHGFSARRIALTLTKIYTSLAPLITQIITIEPHELKFLIDLCQKFCIALNHHQPLHFIYKIESQNIHFLTLQKDFHYVIHTWNQLNQSCAKS